MSDTPVEGTIRESGAYGYEAFIGGEWSPILPMSAFVELHKLRDALSAALAREARLREALKGLTGLYGHIWDMVDGALVLLPDSIEKFEDAHIAAVAALTDAQGDETGETQ